ncbi:MAG: TIGR03621 family F420-dependent LLM class oxidoreductase [Thermomicrobiales bacterium]
MSNAAAFSFAAMIRSADSGEAFLDRVREIEQMGYSSVAMVDHFNPTYSPVPGLTAAAVAAPSLRVLTTVFDNDFRNPVLLAKEIATLDQISGGRVDFGLGAGWHKVDYDQSGIQYDPPGVRISRMEEALTIFKRAWSGEEFSFEGEHYTVKNHSGFPLPVQQPHPPIYIGGGGKRILGIAGREADIIGVHVRFGPEGALDSADTIRAEMEKKIGWIRDGAGDRFGEIRLALLLFAAKIVDSEADKQAEITRIAGANEMSEEAVAASPYFLIGSENELVEQIDGLHETFNISHFTIVAGDADGFAPVVRRLTS